MHRGGDMMGEYDDNQLKYTQQHLANERTYLAWIRTAISIVGIGFLATSLHFTIGQTRSTTADFFSILLGIFACIFGVGLIIVTTKSYHEKRRQIMAGTFYPTKTNLTFVSIALVMMIILIAVYFFAIW